MNTQIQLGDLAVEVVRKNIKHVHLSVHPPTGRVTISAPARLSLDTIRVFAISKLSWIRRQQAKFLVQNRETPREYLDRESHFLWGSRCLLKLVEIDAAPKVELQHRRLRLQVRPGADAARKQAILEDWYRAQLRAAVPPLMAIWEPRLGVKAGRLFVQRMKTRWGSCNTVTRSIRLNSELAKKPRQCLEYVLVHELMHLLERRHNDRFVSLMDRHLPDWPHRRQLLNSFPLAHHAWGY